MEVIGDIAGIEYPYVPGQKGVEGPHDHLWGQPRRRPEGCHLPDGMDTGISPARAENLRIFSSYLLQPLLKHLLNRASPGLYLPAMVARPIILDNQLHVPRHHAALSASTIFIRAALTAGRAPPTNPMTRENPKALNTISKLRLKVKASSEKVWKFIVEMVKSWRKEARKSPTQPPISPRRRDSMRKALRMLLL